MLERQEAVNALVHWLPCASMSPLCVQLLCLLAGSLCAVPLVLLQVNTDVFCRREGRRLHQCISESVLHTLLLLPAQALTQAKSLSYGPTLGFSVQETVVQWPRMVCNFDRKRVRLFTRNSLLSKLRPLPGRRAIHTTSSSCSHSRNASAALRMAAQTADARQTLPVVLAQPQPPQGTSDLKRRGTHCACICCTSSIRKLASHKVCHTTYACTANQALG